MESFRIPIQTKNYLKTLKIKQKEDIMSDIIGEMPEIAEDEDEM